jgi:hypothetical protein
LGVVDEADGERLLELPPPRPTEDPAAQPRLEHMQLGFAHRALEPEQQAIVEVRGIVEAVLVGGGGVFRHRSGTLDPTPL